MPAAAVCCPCGRPLARCCVVAALRDGGVPLADHAYAELGRACELGEDAVLACLRHLCGQGLIEPPRPLPGGAAPPPPDSLDARVLEAIAGGLPLVPRPYEAVGAMLGHPGRAVRDRLQALLDARVIERIGLAGDDGPAAAW